MRTATMRWSALSAMLAQVERCLEANCRIEAKCREEVVSRNRRSAGIPRQADLTKGGPICSRIDAAQRRVQHELNRLTVELLMRDLERKKRKAA